LHPSCLQPGGGPQATAKRDLTESTSQRLVGAGRRLIATPRGSESRAYRLFQRTPSTKPMAAAPTSAANVAKGQT
jgi:hypothetical protein